MLRVHLLRPKVPGHTQRVVSSPATRPTRTSPAIVVAMSSPQDVKPHTFNPEGVPNPPPTYNHVAVTPLLPSSRLVTLAGLTGCDPASQNNPTTLPEQAKIAYSKVETCLAAAGATPRDIVQVSSVPVPMRTTMLQDTLLPVNWSARIDLETVHKVKHYIVRETGDPKVDGTDIVDRGWGELWMEFSK